MRSKKSSRPLSRLSLDGFRIFLTLFGYIKLCNDVLSCSQHPPTPCSDTFIGCACSAVTHPILQKVMTKTSIINANWVYRVMYYLHVPCKCKGYFMIHFVRFLIIFVGTVLCAAPPVPSHGRGADSSCIV